MAKQTELDIIDLDSDDEPSNAKKSTDKSFEVCLSSDSDDDIICEEVVSKGDIEFLGRYDSTKRRNKNRDNVSSSSPGSRTVSSQQSLDSNLTEDNSSTVSPRSHILLPPVIKDSPKTPVDNAKSRQLSPESRKAALERRFRDQLCIDSPSNKLAGSPEPVQPVFKEVADDPMDQSFTSVDTNASVNNDEDQIEGVEDNSVSEAIQPNTVPIETTLEAESSVPEAGVSKKIDNCIQTEAIDTEENQIINEHYVCSYEGCGQEFNNALLHYKHEKKHLNELTNQGIKTFKCTLDDCTFAGLTQSELIYHNSEHFGVYMCRDPLCLYRAESAFNLNRHLISQHNPKKRRQQKGFTCNCGEFSCR